MRLGTICRFGEDIYTGTERTHLYSIEDNRIVRLGEGLGDEQHAEMEACVRDRIVTFEVKGTTVVERTVDETRWVGPNDDSMVVRKKKTCRVGRKETTSKEPTSAERPRP